MSNNTEEKPERDAAEPDSDLTMKPGSEDIERTKSRSPDRTAIVVMVAIVSIAAVLILGWAFWRSGSGGAGRVIAGCKRF